MTLKKVICIDVLWKKIYKERFGGMDGKYYLCIIKRTDTMTQQVDTHRELLFIVSEVDETRDPINIVNRIYMSYEGGVIDETHRDLLLGTLYRNCMKYGVEEWRNAQENDLPF